MGVPIRCKASNQGLVRGLHGLHDLREAEREATIRYPRRNDDYRSSGAADSPRQRRYRIAERLCWALAVLLALPLVAGMAGRAALERSLPDDSWSDSRRAEFQRLIEMGGPAPIGMLSLPRQEVRMPVYSGTGEVGLTLGAGHLPETSPLSGQGNIALAGHRDGYFRKLRHIERGDPVVVETPEGRHRYRVTETWVVAPEEVWVLDPTPEPALTLVTCHPFYFVGHAPNRFVVRAVRVSPSQGDPASAIEKPTVAKANTGGSS